MASVSAFLAGDTLPVRLATLFRDAGAELYLVGGAVRNVLLGRPYDELDFATSALPELTNRLLSTLPEARPFRLGEKFGTIGALVGERRVEITTYRTGEVYEPGSRKPAVRFGTSLLQDLERRDFTINAVALEPLSGELVDPTGGADDLRVGIIRAVGDPPARFKEDPLRLLRAVRFTVALDFALDSATEAAIVAQAQSLRLISHERVRDEYSLLLCLEVPSRAMTMLRDTGLMAHSVPELLELTRMSDHGPRHPLSLWEHEMRVLDAVPSGLAVRWAALLHDIAKPATRTSEPSGRPRFFHHEEAGAAATRAILRGLRYPQTLVEQVALLVESHMQVHAYSREWSDGAVRRLALRLGDCLDDALALARADAEGHGGAGSSINAPRLAELQARIAALETEPTEMRSPLSGDDLMQRYQRPPGRWIGVIKAALENEVMEGRLLPDDVESAWTLADRLVGPSEDR